MTILIIEGCDLSGKSVAIEKISKAFKDGLLIKNLYKPITSNDDKIYSQYQKIISMIEVFSDSSNDRFIILDRFYPSQAVYSFLRGEDEAEDERGIKIEKHCNSIGDYILIYLDTPLKLLQERYDQRGDEHIKRGDLSIIKVRYESFFNKCTLPKIRIDTTKSNWLEQLEDFISAVNAEKGD